MDRFKIKLESAANLLHMVGDELHDVIVMCDHQKYKDIDEIVKDQLELTQMCTPDHFSAHVGKKRYVTYLAQTERHVCTNHRIAFNLPLMGAPMI